MQFPSLPNNIIISAITWQASSEEGLEFNNMQRNLIQPQHKNDNNSEYNAPDVSLYDLKRTTNNPLIFEWEFVD